MGFERGLLLTVIVIQKKLEKFKEKIKKCIHKTQQPYEPLLLTHVFEEQAPKEEDNLSLFNDFLRHDRRSETIDTKDSSGNREVTHIHSAETAGGRVDFLVTSTHEQYDTMERPTSIHVDINYTPNESQDHSSLRDNQPEQKENSHDHSSLHDHIKDAAMSRELDNRMDQANQKSIGSQTQEQISSNNTNTPTRQRSRIYSWCKAKKEKFIGPSKKTIAEQQRSHDSNKHALPKNTQQTQKADTSINKSQANNSQSGPSRTEAKQQNFKNYQARSNIYNVPQKHTTQKANINNFGYSSPPSTYYQNNRYNNKNSHTKTNNDAWNNFVSSWQEMTAKHHADMEAQKIQAYYYSIQKEKENKLLAAYGYTYQVSEKLEQELKNASNELDKAYNNYHNISFFSYDYWFSNKISKYNKDIYHFTESKNRADDAIYKEKKLWRAQSLQKISEIQEEEALQAEQEKAEKIKKQAELLIAYGYKYQLPDTINTQLQEAKTELTKARNRSTLEYWFTNKYANEQIWNAKLKKLEAQIIEDQRASKMQALEEIEKKEQLKAEKLAQEMAAAQAKAAEDAKNEMLEQKKILEQVRKKIEAKKEQKSKEWTIYQKLIQWQIYNKKSLDSSDDFSDDFMDEQLINAQYEWKQLYNMHQVNPQEKMMIDEMLDEIALAENDTSVEFAQAGLQSWAKAQSAQSHVERDYYLKRSKSLHDAMQHTTPKQSIAEQAQPINPTEIDNLLQDYTAAIKIYHEEQEFNRPPTHAKHFDRLEKRAQALSESKEQLSNNALVQRDYEISSQARGFMMANNINYAAFDSTLSVTNFQHCLTQEILSIIESSASITQKYDTRSIIGQLAMYNCNLAVSAQQLNQLAHIQQATAITDLAHFFDAYAQFILQDEFAYEAQVRAGMYDGTVQALQKWGNFLKDLGCQPRQTIGQIVTNLQILGTSLYNIIGQASEFMPHAYLNDATQDLLDNLAAIKNSNGDSFNQHQSNRVIQRAERNAQALQNGWHGAVQTAQLIVDDMMKKSLRENVASATEIAIDVFITNKATDCLMKIAEIVGTPILHAAQTLTESIPSDLGNSHPIFMTNANTGELLAIADTTGESIGAAVAAKKLADNAEQIIKNAAKAKELTDKINEITKADKAKKEVTKLNKELAEVTNATEIINVDRLKEISNDIPQVEEFRKYTNDFNNLEKLKPEEVLYLNLCDWIELKATKINDRLKASGGIKFIDPATKTEIIIEEFDLIHSLIGEMKPQALANRTSGGHLFIPELRAATLDIGEIKQFGNGFFDMEIKYAGKVGGQYKNNSYFPISTTPQEAINIIEDVILNFKDIRRMKTKDSTLQGFIFTNQQEQDFAVLIKNKTMQFFPMKPE